MSRKYKFRAWDGQDMLFIDGSDDAEDVKVMDWDLLFDKERGVDLMQYTGLKDKNGKEIYEGDIGYPSRHPERPENLFVVTWDPLTCGYMWARQNKKGEPGYTGFGGVHEDGERTTYKRAGLMGSPDKYGARVIGNIYEDPELLTRND